MAHQTLIKHALTWTTSVYLVNVQKMARNTAIYRKIPKISPGAYIFQRPFLEGLIFGRAYIRRGLCTEGILRFKIDCANLIVGRRFTVFALFDFVFEGNFQVQAPGGLHLEGRFNGGFFALRV